MAALPLPNLPGNLYINTADVLRQNNDNYSARVDYQIGRPAAAVRALFRSRARTPPFRPRFPAAPASTTPCRATWRRASRR